MAERVRDVTFDIMKGIGILFMLVGHWPEVPHWLRQFIYSFHMPLFFLVAGYFSKPMNERGLGAVIQKNALRLLLPFIATQILMIVWGGVQSFAKHDFSYVIKPSLSLLWGSCDVIDSRWGSIYIGPMWFLPALFWCRTVFELLLSKVHDWMLLVVCAVISVASIALHCYTYSPWCILQGLSCLIFMSIGYLVKTSLFPKWIYWVLILCWPFAIFFSNVEVSDCSYHLYLLAVLGACGGTLLVWWISNLIKKNKAISKPLVWFGVNSLVVLCFHNFELFSSISYSVIGHLPCDIHGSLMTVFRYMLTVVLVLIVINMPYVRELYGVNWKK